MYFDASVLIKRYSQEEGTLLVNEIFQYSKTVHLFCSLIGILEVISILVRKRNDGRIPQALFEQAILEFKAEVIDNKSFLATSVNDIMLFESTTFIAKHNLNATDAIILRSVTIVKEVLGNANSLILWSSDKRLGRAAKSEGIEVFDPEIETMDSLRQMIHISP